MSAKLIMSAKLAFPGLLKTKVILKNCYDVITSVHDVIISVYERSYHNVNFITFKIEVMITYDNFSY